MLAASGRDGYPKTTTLLFSKACGDWIPLVGDVPYVGRSGAPPHCQMSQGDRVDLVLTAIELVRGLTLSPNANRLDRNIAPRLWTEANT